MKEEIHTLDPVLIVSKEVPEYSGYQDRKNLNKSDKQLRIYLWEKLNAIASQFDKRKNQILSVCHNDCRETVENISQSLIALQETLRNPCYCNQGKIVKEKLTQHQIAQLHDYDSQLMEHIQILEEEINFLPEEIHQDEISDILAHIYDLIDGFNQYLTEREIVFLGEED